MGARLSSTGCSRIDFVEDGSRPLRLLLLDQGLGLLDVVDDILLDQLLHDEGLVELERHLGGKTALVELQLGTGTTMTERPE